VTYKDAIRKLNYASKQIEEKPFFLVVGIKRPHLNWRYPVGYHDMYQNVSLPSQRVLDESINPIAYTVFPMNVPSDENQSHVVNIVHSPYDSGSDRQVQLFFRYKNLMNNSNIYPLQDKY